MKKILLTIISLLVVITDALAQYKEPERHVTSFKPLEGIEYKVELQGAMSNEKTPLWLNANRYGLSSLEKSNGYLRGALERPIERDAERRWGLGYGLDVAVPVR